MSKYDSLWKHIQRSGEDGLDLTFDEIAAIAGLPIDHSFLNYKKRAPRLWLRSRKDLP